MIKNLLLIIIFLIATSTNSKAAEDQTPSKAQKAQIENCLKSDDKTKCEGVVSKACIDKGFDNQTTAGMANCVWTESKIWDELLNRDYKKLISLLEPNQQASLKTAERDWLKSRKSKCDFASDFWGYGTMRITEASSCYEAETANQEIWLRIWLNVINER